MQEKVTSPDGGPIYFESRFEQLFPEPWNAMSAIIFCFIVVYWFRKLWPVRNEHPFLFYSLPVLMIGGIGGTLYHAFRVSRVFLVMDWLPILLLSLAASFYFLHKLRYKWWVPLMVFGLFMLLEYLNYTFISKKYAINISYSLMGVFVLSPVFIYLYKHQWRESRFIAVALFSFVLAVTFRSIDSWGVLPMGTHFLWHTFGALTCHFMYVFIYRLNLKVHKKAPARAEA